VAKISALPNTLTDPAKEDLLAVVDDGDGETKKMTLETLLNLIYPIGSLYANAEDDTNPGTLFGFGTWARIAVGRTIVGVNEADADFETPGLTGGQKTVQAHSHTITTVNDDFNSSGGAGPSWAADSAGSYSGKSTNSFGSGTNNMNPYETAYTWKRTA